MDSEDACEVVPRVFFGPASTTFYPNKLKHFTHIVNCDSYSSSTSTAGQLKQFLFLPSEDNEEFLILNKHFTPLFHFIQEALQNPSSNVYIHCYMGWNRSACLAIAYAWYVQQTSKSMKQVLQEVKEKCKRDILTNDDFVKQLFEFTSL
jgi:protein-tyrosine phosphatase